jgi:hypothetical protein
MLLRELERCVIDGLWTADQAEHWWQECGKKSTLADRGAETIASPVAPSGSQTIAYPGETDPTAP